MRRDYFASALITADGPFSGELIVAERALCPDGIRRDARPSADGIADTFYSIPAFVYVGSTRVYGYVTVETVNGFSVDMGPDDPETVKFVPYLYRKNWTKVYCPIAVWAILARQAFVGSETWRYAMPYTYAENYNARDTVRDLWAAAGKTYPYGPEV